MLLPLPETDARATSLENHLALVTLRAGHGNTDQMSTLLRAVYIACLLHEAAHGRGALEFFRQAGEVLTQSIRRAEREEGWGLPDADGLVLEEILTLYDEQLASTPVHRVAAAHARLRRPALNSRLSRQPRSAPNQPFDAQL
jgi:hypothetical protein